MRWETRANGRAHANTQPLLGRRWWHSFALVERAAVHNPSPPPIKPAREGIPAVETQIFLLGEGEVIREEKETLQTRTSRLHSA